MSKIVITGIGIISPYGMGKDVFRDCVLREASAPSRAARLIPDFDERAFLDSKAIKYLQRAEKLALIASSFALSDAKLDSSHLQEMDVGVAIGSVASNMRAVAAFDRQVLCGEANYLDPSLVPSGIMNSLSGNVSIRHGIRGFHVPVAAGEASGVQAIQFALTQLQARRVEAVLAGGVDEFYEELPFNGEAGSKPSEGAAILALEAIDSADRRQADAYAECAGFGFAYAPEGRSNKEKSINAATRAIEQACGDAQIQPRDIDLVFASASGSAITGAIEAEALSRFFGDGLPLPQVTSINQALGESLGASGAFAVAAAALAIKDSIATLTNNRKAGIKHVLIDSFSGEGHMSCLVLRKIDRRLHGAAGRSDHG